ncbi:hypothetical protein EK904_007332 [Melospiza melodia maxima]|nr:hypothetical protein EK904_007332 [Melospiza melodia maxima]
MQLMDKKVALMNPMKKEAQHRKLYKEQAKSAESQQLNNMSKLRVVISSAYIKAMKQPLRRIVCCFCAFSKKKMAFSHDNGQHFGARKKSNFQNAFFIMSLASQKAVNTVSRI